MIRVNKRKPAKALRTQPRRREHNFLKYLRVVQYFIKRKYDINQAELDMLLYLYDVPYFRRDDFDFYGKTLSWDAHRFYDMVHKGLIKEWREGGVKDGRAKLWELSYKSKKICSLTYKKLLGEESISESARENPIFKKEKYTDKVYKMVIEKMNKSRRGSDTA